MSQVRQRQPYDEFSTGDRLSRIEATVGGMAEDIRDIKSELHAVAETAFPRTEADGRSRDTDRRMLEMTGEVAKRLEISTYQVAHDALIQRVARLESNPQRQIGWYALAISAAGCLVTALGIVLAFVVSVASIVINTLK